ncbi:MAG: amidase [Phreatobacter sp.]|uniref:amidase n=1 Tax=Phreatobacter sp. TaxID=1966341 RepID=UPI001A3F702F|nr:amidase family protein [Phreatobacter sp.]MBL8571861.1 amidase [Phreatobacter sp.]
MTELCDLTAVELRRLIGAKQISPVELLASCEARIARVNPRLNAVTATCWDRARAEAAAAEAKVRRGEALGLLEGLPLGVKDLNETEGLRTTWGSPIYKDHVPAKDERMVAACRAAGAIVVGKTNVPEFGAGANTNNPVYGPTRNPFDTARICGGSSGGSAVALAASMLPICTGSDTGGSLRTPAAFCGIVGFRVSPGVVPTERRPLGWTNISVQGPMGRNVADAALLLAAQVRSDGADPHFHGIDPALLRPPAPADLGSLRLAVSTDLGFAIVDARIRAAFADRVKRIGGWFRECAWADPDMAEADETFEVIRAQNFLASQLENYRTRRHLLGPNIVANVEQGLGYSAVDVAKAHARQTRIFRGFQEYFRAHDVLICPAVTIPPFPIEQLYAEEVDGVRMRTYFHWLSMAYGVTLTGHPAITIPCGLEPTGTPMHLQIVGPYGGDAKVLSIALALEQAMASDPALRRPLPDLAKLAA